MGEWEENRAFLARIREAGADDAPRLIYADWLDEHCRPGSPGWPPTPDDSGVSAQAALIRLECDPARDATATAGRQRVLRDTLIDALGPDVARVVREQPRRLTFDRGLISKLNIMYTPVAALPDGLSIPGDLWVSGTQITRLPEPLTVGGDLYVSFTPISRLPEDLTVGGNLNLSDTLVTRLPDGLTVGGKLILRNCGFEEPDVEHLLTTPGLSPLARVTALESLDLPHLAALVAPQVDRPRGREPGSR